MKVDRRSFLGLGLGAAAGFAVSPVGIKLTDDSSIWTQNWPWTPVPVDGEANYDTSVCSLCPGACGISVRKIDDRPVKIEGLNGHPINDGGACLHGIAGLQYLYDPSRVKTPLKKTAEGKFVEITWEEALETVSTKLSDIRKEKGSDKLACIIDKEEGSVSGLFKRLLSTFGSPNVYTMPSLETNLQAVAGSMHGEGKTIGFDLDNADFVLSFGAGVIEGWGSPVACFKANATKKERHAKFYQIEPRLSNTAASADNWIPVNPGTEADLALGLCAAIIKNNLKTSVSTAGFRGNFNKLVSVLAKDYTPAKTAELTGVDSTEIEKLAGKFAKAKMPVAVFGKGRGDGAQSLKEMAAVQLLNCLAGNINQRGGAFVMDTIDYLEFPGESKDSIATAGAGKKKTGMYVQQMIEAVSTASQPVVEALLVYNANPCYALRSVEQAKKAISNIPFVVSMTSFMDETAQMADIVLPVHTFLEKTEDVPSGAGLAKKVVGLTREIVSPVFDSRHPGDVVIAIAGSMDAAIADNFQWETYEECIEAVTAGIWDSLSEEGFAVLSTDVPSDAADVNVAFLSNNPETIKAQGDFNHTLIPIDNMRLVSGAVASSAFAVKTVADTVIKGQDSVIEINPKTGKSVGLKDCGYASLTTPMGTAKVMVSFNEGMMPGIIGLVEGLGHNGENKYIAGKGVNVNALIGPVIESGSGLDAAFGIKAKITKA